MRRMLFGICCATVLLFPAVSRPVADKPALRLMKTAPFVVRGTHFQPAEHVTVTLAGRTLYRRSTTAGASGAFTVTFTGVSASRCRIYGFHAAGDRGSSASFRTASDCPPPRGGELRLPADPIPWKTRHP
jgi:hypothetical protein